MRLEYLRKKKKLLSESILQDCHVTQNASNYFSPYPPLQQRGLMRATDHHPPHRQQKSSAPAPVSNSTALIIRNIGVCPATVFNFAACTILLLDWRFAPVCDAVSQIIRNVGL
jgi:hypothetical protein